MYIVGNNEEATNLSISSITTTPASAMDFFKTATSNGGDTYNATINNNSLITNNNTSIKNERLSPLQQQQQIQSQSMAQHNGGNGDAQSSNSR